MSVSKLKEILLEIDHPVYIDIIDSCWYIDYFDIAWNTDDNEEDLENGDGNTYSVETKGAHSEYDGYLVVNADTGCGETVTYFFNLEREVKV
jgi:hypothetical protein